MLNNLLDLRKSRIKKKRLGRGTGSGRGKTSGRGHKGQKSRSGVSLKGFEGGQMPIYRRTPKRGFHNNFKKDFNILNLVDLQRLLDKKIVNTNDEINDDILLKKNIIKKKLNGIKILGKGEIKGKIRIRAAKASKSALKKIEKVGGKIELLEHKIQNKIKKKENNNKEIQEKKK